MTFRALHGLCAAFAAVVALSLGAYAADEQQAPQYEPPEREAAAGITLVKLVQERLHRLGLYSGRIDGDLSGAAQAALVRFQLDQLLPASGSLDDATLAALRLERKEAPTATAASEGASAAAGGTALVPASPENKDAK